MDRLNIIGYSFKTLKLDDIDDTDDDLISSISLHEYHKQETVITYYHSKHNDNKNSLF